MLITICLIIGALVLSTLWICTTNNSHRNEIVKKEEVEKVERVEVRPHEGIEATYVQRGLKINKQGKKYYTDKYYTFTRNGKQIDFRDGYDYGDDLLYLICLRTFRYEFRNYLDHVDPACEYCGYRNMSPAQLSFYNKCLHFLGDAPYKDETIIVDGMNITGYRQVRSAIPPPPFSVLGA